MSKRTVCTACGEPMEIHLRMGKARICVAPVPENETREAWIGLLLLRIQEWIQER
jgi:hypothetical protein